MSATTFLTVSTSLSNATAARSTSLVGRRVAKGAEEQCTLQHEPIDVGRPDEPVEEALQRVQLMHLVGRTARPPSEVLQVEVCAALDVGPGRSPAHSRTWSASRMGVVARGPKRRAMVNSVEGWEPDRRSQRLRASTAWSDPSR
jgi:hypothetical protein